MGIKKDDKDQGSIRLHSHFPWEKEKEKERVRVGEECCCLRQPLTRTLSQREREEDQREREEEQGEREAKLPTHPSGIWPARRG